MVGTSGERYGCFSLGIQNRSSEVVKFRDKGGRASGSDSESRSLLLHLDSDSGGVDLGLVMMMMIHDEL